MAGASGRTGGAPARARAARGPDQGGLAGFVLAALVARRVPAGPGQIDMGFGDAHALRARLGGEPRLGIGQDRRAVSVSTVSRTAVP